MKAKKYLPPGWSIEREASYLGVSSVLYGPFGRSMACYNQTLVEADRSLTKWAWECYERHAKAKTLTNGNRKAKS